MIWYHSMPVTWSTNIIDTASTTKKPRGGIWSFFNSFGKRLTQVVDLDLVVILLKRDQDSLCIYRGAKEGYGKVNCKIFSLH